MQSYLQYRAFHRQAVSSQTDSSISRSQEPIRRNAGHPWTEDTNRSIPDQFTDDKISVANFLVSFEGSDDPFDPHNWPFRSRFLATAHIGTITLVAGMAAAIDASALPQAAKEFHVSDVAETLATGMFLIGFGCSGFFGGPLSETFGRNPIYIGSLVLFGLFTLGSALAPDLGAQLVCRFFGGFFASTPFTIAGGSLSDLWTPVERMYTFPVFATTGFVGPILGPVMGGFIAESSVVSWRWTEWTTLIMVSLVLLSVLFFMPETFSPVLLSWKAHHLRMVTGDPRYRASVEVKGVPFRERMKIALYRPFLMAATEPIIIVFSLYFVVIYMVMFGFLPGYTFIFQDVYGMSQGITGLLFLGIGVGLCLATALVPLIHFWAKRDMKKLQEACPDIVIKLPPEYRLWFAMLGAPGLPISLFWMGWTAFPSVSYWSPLVASVFFGYGILTIFISIYQYVIDSYEMYAASALGVTTFVRFLAAGGMMEATIPMYKNLGVHWTLTVLGSIGLVFTPVPYLLYKYGHVIRKYSRHAVA